VIRERMRERKTRVMKVSREANCASHGLGAWLNWVEQMVEPHCGFPPEIAAAINSDCTHPVMHLIISLFPAKKKPWLGLDRTLLAVNVRGS
jgi:hypothetical protein